ncbi:hypothetical protein ACWGDX_13300 [Streptomyces sp. NPDC055025]
MAQYHISNVTVQRALTALKSEGFAIGRAGAGVYVTSPTPSEAADPNSHTARLIGSGEASASAEVARSLNIDAGKSVQREQFVVETDASPSSPVISASASTARPSSSTSRTPALSTVVFRSRSNR